MPIYYYIAVVNCDCFAFASYRKYRATTSYNQSFRERQSCFAFHILLRALYSRVVLPTS